MKALLAIALAAVAASAGAQRACPAPGEPMHWIVDYCMLKMETDDEIAVSGCIEQEARRRFAGACARKLHFKKRMCERMIRSGTHAGSVGACVNDPAFKGRTVSSGGVGG